MKNLAKFVLASAVAIPALQLVAQDKSPKPPEHFYHLVFHIEESDNTGEVINSRCYTGNAVTGNVRHWQIRTGTKIPVPASDKGDVQYFDVGVDIGFKGQRTMAPNYA